ncbi:MAG: sarcosine oxidase subunit delta [Gammaproteobacteria bacterium]|nr:sarcosine oxidase subunit delta [Gammaproteobacteria bacterium]
MRIHCPFCGPRGHDEFVYHGDAAPRRPPVDAPDAAFHDYVYLRDNPAGSHRELWFHAAGCHSWLVVERDTRTHGIRSVAFARGGA